MNQDFMVRYEMGTFGAICGLAREVLDEEDYNPQLVKLDEEDIRGSLLTKIGAEFLSMNAKVDIRERGGVYNIMEGWGFEVCVLKIGDTVTDKVAFERKSGDFFSSVFDKKIFKQMHEIKHTHPLAFLVIDRPIEDLFQEAATRKISENAVIGALASCAVRGFPPLFLDNKDWTTRFMNAVVLKAKDSRNRDAEYDSLRGVKSSVDLIEHMLYRLPGFGGKAVNIIRPHVETLEEALDLIYRIPDMDNQERKEKGFSKIRAKCEKLKPLIRKEQQVSSIENKM
jgi:ERCC4-type nuclease